MINIMDRMTRMEAEMVARDQMMEKESDTRDQKIAELKDSMEEMQTILETREQRIVLLEDTVEMLEKAVITKDVFTDAIETRDTQMCELEEEMKSLTGRITVTEETDVLLRGMVDQVRNPPFAFQCAYNMSGRQTTV